jgi:hypothetical protein
MEDLKSYFHKACRSQHARTAQKYVDELSESAKANPRPFLYGTLFILASLWLLVTAVAKLRRQALPTPSRPRTPDPEKKAIGQPPGGFKYAMQTAGGMFSCSCL